MNANAGFSFNTQGVPPKERDYDLIAVGWYLQQVVETELVDLGSGNGQALKIVTEILVKPYQGRKVFTRLNVRHNSPEAERIAQQDLREICDAVGLPNGFANSVQLHGRPFQGRIGIKKNKDNRKDPKTGLPYEPQNELKGAKPANAAVPSAQASAATAMPSANQQPSAAAQQSDPASTVATGKKPAPWLGKN